MSHMLYVGCERTVAVQKLKSVETLNNKALGEDEALDSSPLSLQESVSTSTGISLKSLSF